MARKQSDIMQNLTYLTVGLKKLKAEHDYWVKEGIKKEDTRLSIPNRKASFAYRIAISGIENIMKKEQKRLDKERKKSNKYGWL